jgi:hypothetical protein
VPSTSPSVGGSQFTTEKDCLAAGGTWLSATNRCQLSR